MNRFIIILACICFGLELSAQNLYDQYYMMGRYSGLISFAVPDTVTATFPVSWKLSPIATLAFICDKNGNPQFYTNGAQIGAISGDTLLASGMIDMAVSYDYGHGMPMQQGAIILPKNDCQYYCIYYSVSDSFYNLGYNQPNRLYYALVDMCANNGRGQVLSVKNIIYNDFMGMCRMTACKHANGRDWWLVVHGDEDNNYFKFLVTPDSIFGPSQQQIGRAELEGVLGQAVFSSDGSKYASITGNSPLVLLDFDRCTGEFSNPISINVPFLYPYQISGSGALGCAFSPSGRYIYVNEYSQIVQFDLLADTIQNTMALAGEYIYDSSGQQYTDIFNSAYLAPNGKIYFDNSGGGPKCFHVINYPDSVAANCGYDKNGICLSYVGAYPISNMPHYRLGALAGSACDTLNTSVSAIQQEAKSLLLIRPNPASDNVMVSLTEYMKNAMLQITDVTGKMVYESKQFYLDDLINVNKWAKGEYFVKVSNGVKVEVAKFSKQ